MKTRPLVLAAVLSLLLPCAISLTLEEEIPANTLKVTFKEVTLSQWNSQGSSLIFRKEVANLTDTYCALRSTDCSIQQYNKSNPITTDNVFISGVPLETTGNDLEVQFYVTLTGQTEITEAGPDHVIALAVLKEILISGQSEMEEVMGYKMMYIDSLLVLPPLDHTMNIIMIPISCALLIIVIIVAVVLHCVEKRREEDMKGKIRSRSRSKVSPSPKDVEVGKDMGNMGHLKPIQSNGEFSETKNERHRKKKKKDRRSKHDDSYGSGEDNHGYATTPRGKAEKEYNIKPGSEQNYDNNFDKQETKDYDKADEDDKHLRQSREYRDDERYDSYDDHDRSRHRSRKKKHKRRGRRHRDESSETDPEVAYHQAPSRLPPLSEPNHATTEL